MTENEKQTLTALIDRLIPADSEWPSASQNGVFEYLDRQLSADLTRFTEWIFTGLRQLDIESLQINGKLFADISVADQDKTIAALESGDVQTSWPISPVEFFNRVVEWTAEGYYADPEHNFGNPQKLSWQMVGFDERK